MFDVIKKTIKSSALYGIGTISSKLIGFILIPLYTSYLTTSDFGILSIVEITTTLITAVISLKINAALFRWYYDKNYLTKQKSIFFTSLVLPTLFSVITFFIFYLYVDKLSIIIFETNSYSYLLILMYISASFQVVFDLVLYLMRLQDKALFYSTISILRLFIGLILIIIFVTILNRNVEGIYEAIVISQIITTFFVLKYIIKNSQYKIELKIFNDMLKFSLPLIFAEISGIILTISDRYSLNFLSTASEVGVYSLGFKIANTTRVFLYSSVMLAVSPMIYSYIDKPSNKRFYSKLLTYFAFGVMIFTLMLSLFAENLVYILAEDESYWSAINLVPIIAFAILFGTLKDIILTGLNITKKTLIIAVVVILMAALNIFLNIILIPDYNSYGAAIAALVSRIFSLIIFYFIAQKYYFIPYEIYKVFLIILAGTILTAISSLVIIENIYLSSLFKFVLLSAFPIILYYLKFFEEIELVRISGIWHKWKNPFKWIENIKQIKF